jgi:hypothetical protein
MTTKKRFARQANQPRVSREQARAWPASDPRSIEEIERAYVEQEPSAPYYAIEAALRAGSGRPGTEIASIIHSTLKTDKIAEDAVAKSNSERARHAARQSRPDALGDVLLQIEKQKPALPAKRVVRELEGKAYRGTIVAVNESAIEWRDKFGKTKTTKLSALPSRISRIRKQAARDL